MALEKDAVSDQLQQWILDAYSGLDSDAVEGRKKSTKALVKARSAAAKNKKAKTDECYGLWRDWAANIHKAFPSYLHGKLAEEVKKLADAAGHKMVNGNLYSVVTIKDVITGVKKASKNTP